MLWPGRQPAVLAPSPRVLRAFLSAASGSGSQKFWRPLPGCSTPFPSAASGSGSQRFAHAFPRCGVPFPSAASGSGSQGLVRTVPRARHAFSLRGERPGRPESWRLLPWRGAPFPSAASSPGSQRFGALSTGASRLFPPRPQRMPPVGSQEVFRQELGPVCWVGGGGFSGAEFAPFPSPCLLPPAGMGRLSSGVSQSLCFANRLRCVPAT